MADLLFNFADITIAFGMVVMRGVTEIQAEHVCTGFSQCADGLAVGASGAKRGEDADFALAGGYKWVSGLPNSLTVSSTNISLSTGGTLNFQGSVDDTSGVDSVVFVSGRGRGSSHG